MNIVTIILLLAHCSINSSVWCSHEVEVDDVIVEQLPGPQCM